MSIVYMTERRAKLIAQVDAIDAAILVVVTSGQSYTLDTGQTRQTVTRANVSEMRILRKALLDEIAAIDSALGGSSSVYVRPGF